MKTEGQVNQKIKQVIFRHRKEFIRQGLAKRPENCEHNRKVRLPVHTGNRASIRVCGYEDNGVVCDSTMAGDRQAENCPYFSCCQTAEDLKTEFNAKVGLDGTQVQIGYIAKEYPDIAALMWVLGPGKNTNKEQPDEGDNAILALFGTNTEEPTEVPDRPLVEDTE